MLTKKKRASQITSANNNCKKDKYCLGKWCKQVCIFSNYRPSVVVKEKSAHLAWINKEWLHINKKNILDYIRGKWLAIDRRQWRHLVISRRRRRRQRRPPPKLRFLSEQNSWRTTLVLNATLKLFQRILAVERGLQFNIQCAQLKDHLPLNKVKNCYAKSTHFA